MIRAVLFDVGGPLDTEVEHERAMDAHIRAALASEGVAITDAAYGDAVAAAVASFASDTYAAILWHVLAPDVEAARRAHEFVRLRSPATHGFQLRERIADLLERLHARGLLLGLAANQPLTAIEKLDAAGIGRYFHHREVSAMHGYRKPDPRIFLRACDDLGVTPHETIMVGDRIDNDIAPAKLLGMRAILLRTGRHSAQQPRTWHELADAEVRDAAEMETAITRLCKEG